MESWTFQKPVSTDRITLRVMSDDDLDAIFAYQSRSDVCRYLPFEPRTREQVAAKIAEWSSRTRFAEDDDYFELAIERRSDGRMLGELHFSLKSVEHQCAEIGWVLDPEHQGNGYVTEAASAMMTIGFDTIGLHRIVAELTPENTASVAVCRRLGMREEAHFVEDMMIKGRWEDTGIHAILRREWAQRG